MDTVSMDTIARKGKNEYPNKGNENSEGFAVFSIGYAHPELGKARSPNEVSLKPSSSTSLLHSDVDPSSIP